ncbi:MAG TPA: M48 family metallopeptidase [Solirubrobacteraceae bacterium]|nr:M48 family metallopeptidase [Solirubrobacteraceae bacterium]
MTTLPEDQRLAGISAKAYEHPADRAATAALQSIPMLDTVVRKLIEYGYERALRQQFLAGSVRLGEDQLPAIWADWNAVCARLDLPERYDLYLTQFPIANAAAIGSGTPMVVVNSRTLDLLDDLEMRTVLGHEAGHILSDHVLYRTALIILLSLSGVGRLPVFAGLPLLGVKLALLEWFRAAELSCDRAATLVTRDPLVTCRTMLVLAGGMSSRKLNLDAFIRQATDYEDWDSGWDRINRLRTELALTHAYPVRRVKEVMTWVRSGEYDRILAGSFQTREGETADARQAAGDAFEYYAARFRGFLKDTGVGMEKAGDAVGEAAGRMSEWLRSQQRSRPS